MKVAMSISGCSLTYVGHGPQLDGAAVDLNAFDIILD